jgi:transposase
MFVFIMIFKAKHFVFVDETGLNREYRRLYARAKRGVKVHDTRPGKRQKRTNIIGALWGEKHIAMQCYEHSTTSAFFEDWFEFELIPLLPTGAVIVMDNASFHRKNALWKIAEKYGVFVLFLPPYSPEFNPIEHSWANFKRWLCDNYNRFSCFDFAVETYFT